MADQVEYSSAKVPGAVRAANSLAKLIGVILWSANVAETSPSAVFSDALIAKLDCPDRVNDVAFSPRGQFLAAAYGWNRESGLRVWKASDRTVVYTWVEQHAKEVDIDIDKVAFSPDATSLAAATSAGDILVWSTGAWTDPKRITLKSGSPSALTFSIDAHELALSTDSAVFVCSLKTWHCRKLSSRAGPAQPFTAAGFSSDGTKLAVCRSAAVQWWDVATGQAIQSWSATGINFFCGLSPSRKYIVAGGGAVYRDKNVALLNASTGQSLGYVSAARSGLFASAISHSDQWVALGGGSYGPGGDLSLWRLRDFHQMGFVSAGRFPIQGLAFSPDDTILAAGSHDGVVFLFSVEKLRGPERTRQEFDLCGEILSEGKKVYVVPLAKGPTPMNPEFDYAWKLEVADPGALTALGGYPVIFQNWEIESDAATDRVRANKFAPLWSGPRTVKLSTEYAVFGDVQNPGWDKGFVVKVYRAGGFVAATNGGQCIAYGPLSLTKIGDFDTLKARLVGEGLLAVPRDPLTLGADHYRTRFIELSYGGKVQIRTDAGVMFAGTPQTKREAFTRVFNQEQPFIDSLLHAGTRSVQ